MSQKNVRRPVLRGLAIVGLALFAGACANSPAAPDPSVQRPQPRTAAAHDDDPPETACRSGWINMDGRWYCAD